MRIISLAIAIILHSKENLSEAFISQALTNPRVESSMVMASTTDMFASHNLPQLSPHPTIPFLQSTKPTTP
ncbi:hypothetical protein ACHAW6_001721 [Cyclotella cf. meneghiniana]